ncbi:MAG: hypothetical protein GZ085_10575 [Sulfuriferula multivorans]|uniref:Uncharacterized protein n=1 Tax=Sulfuriferula multivorans TaxID=1559896 RepID=A0A7C9P8P2_9PROT|nr:hypothetical protein [Sulfuriferula multivorans]
MKKICMLMMLGLFVGQPALAEESVAKKAGDGIKQGGEAAGNGIEKGIESTEKGLKKAADATGKGLETAGQWIEKKVHGDK